SPCGRWASCSCCISCGSPCSTRSSSPAFNKSKSGNGVMRAWRRSCRQEGNGPMPERSIIRQIVFTYDADELLVNAAKEEAGGATVVAAATEDDLRREIVDAQMTIGAGYSDEVRSTAPGLVWHHVPWAGVESVVTTMLREQGTILTNSSGISAPAMAEHAIAFMLSFARAFPLFYREQERHSWRGWE